MPFASSPRRNARVPMRLPLSSALGGRTPVGLCPTPCRCLRTLQRPSPRANNNRAPATGSPRANNNRAPATGLARRPRRPSPRRPNRRASSRRALVVGEAQRRASSSSLPAMAEGGGAAR